MTSFNLMVTRRNYKYKIKKKVGVSKRERQVIKNIINTDCSLITSPKVCIGNLPMSWFSKINYNFTYHKPEIIQEMILIIYARHIMKGTH